MILGQIYHQHLTLFNCNEKVRNTFFWLVAIAVVVLAIAPNSRGEQSLPVPQVHPLPPSLALWQTKDSIGDYFSQVEPTPVGYLVWSEFPVKVWIQRPENPDEDTGSTRRFRKWVEAVESGVVEWGQYLPLEEVQSREKADIIIEYAAPPWNPTFNRETGKFDIPRARSAQTNYKFYLSEDSPPILRHRMTIQISPGMSYDSTVAAIRHEMGHALGIWGHSLQETDALYFSQVRDPLPVSVRDVNTLKRVYEQPTSLGRVINQ